jgi:hypothetical protein
MSIDRHCIDPASTRLYDSHNQADVLATAAGSVLLAAAGSRVAVWVALNGAVALSATQTVQVGILTSGLFTALASISLSQPSIYMSILQYGSVIQQQIIAQSPAVNQTVSVGSLVRTYHEG